MIAARLSSVWQVAGVAGAALICYLVSQSVATERAGLARVDRQITATRDQIAKLQTEISARARMTQLDAWNGTFGLKAARPAQYVDSGVQLAALYGRKGQPAIQLDPRIVTSHGAIDRVAYMPTPAVASPAIAAPARPAPVPRPAIAITPPPPQPMLRTATFVRPKPSPLAQDGAGPTLTRASFTVPAPVPARALPSLLPADIGALAAAEAKDRAKPAKSER